MREYTFFFYAALKKRSLCCLIIFLTIVLHKGFRSYHWAEMIQCLCGIFVGLEVLIVSHKHEKNATIKTIMLFLIAVFTTFVKKNLYCSVIIFLNSLQKCLCFLTLIDPGGPGGGAIRPPNFKIVISRQFLYISQGCRFKKKILNFGLPHNHWIISTQ